MAQDIGRNDPCPCGSGRKYKQCCLRKPKAPEKAPEPTWQERFEASAKDVEDTWFLEDKQAAMQAWIRGWKALQYNVSDAVDTLDRAQQAFGKDAPQIERWLWKVQRFARETVENGTYPAEGVVDLIEQVLRRFAAEPSSFRRVWEADLASFQWRAGYPEEAEEILRRHIAEVPLDGRAYCEFANMYLEADPPRLQPALDILEQAAAAPIADPEKWNLSGLIQSLRAQIATNRMRESEHFIAWDAFLEDFEAANLDKKLEMTRERIDNAPDFDEEWVFSLMIDGLLMPCRREARGKDWLVVLEYLREKRPEFVEPESGVLGANAVRFALAGEGEGDRLDPALELLFGNPGKAVDHIFRTLELLAYCGESRVLEQLLGRWSFFRRTAGIPKSALSRWPDWTVRAQLAAWVEEDPQKPRTFQELRDAVGYMLTNLDAARVETLVTRFTAPEIDTFDAARLAAIEPASEQPAALAFAFARSLITQHRWPAFKAVLAGVNLATFLTQQADCDDPFKHELSTKTASTSKKLREELKQFRDLWRQDSPFAPHPDLAIGFADALSQHTFFGSPYAAATFLEATTHLAPWLAQRGIIENSELVEATQHHFAHRFSEATEGLLRMAGEHPRLVEGLAETETWLKVSSR